MGVSESNKQYFTLYLIMAFCAPCFGGNAPGSEPSVFDFAIVGGGMGGAYLANELRKRNKKLKICVFEASHRIGGRLLSDDNDEDNRTNKDELGGMRIFPSVQQDVARIVKESGCHLTGIGLMDAGNWFYRDGKATQKR